MAGNDILLVTLKMDDVSFAHFDALRRRYFPIELNKMPAHITMFHGLPGNQHMAVAAHLDKMAGQQKQFIMRTNGVALMGRGVAYTLHSLDAVALHAKLQAHWFDWLKTEDRLYAYKPHITVQSKVEPFAAEELQRELQSGFSPQSITAIGFDLWYYGTGPWEPINSFEFTPPV